MATIIVEKDGYVSGSSLYSGGTHVTGKTWKFDADHWHDYKESQHGGYRLDIINDTGDVIAMFQPSCWNRVYFGDVLLEDK